MASTSSTLTGLGGPGPVSLQLPARSSSATMRKVSLRNLAAHKVRLVLTVLSVVLGTAFVAGSFVFTDTLQRTFNGIFDDTAQGVDVRVSGQDDNGSGVPLADLDRLRAVPGVQKVEPGITGQIVLLGSNGKAVKGGGAPSLGLSYLPPERQLALANHVENGERAVGFHRIKRPEGERAKRILHPIDLVANDFRVVDVEGSSVTIGELDGRDAADVKKFILEREHRAADYMVVRLSRCQVAARQPDSPDNLPTC